MTKVKVSPKDEVLLPKAVMEAHGFADGAEIEVSGSGEQVVLRLVEAKPALPGAEKLTLEEFLAMRISYDGPPIADEMMHAAIDQAALEDWARLERQWHADKSD